MFPPELVYLLDQTIKTSVKMQVMSKDLGSDLSASQYHPWGNCFSDQAAGDPGDGMMPVGSKSLGLKRGAAPHEV